MHVMPPLAINLNYRNVLAANGFQILKIAPMGPTGIALQVRRSGIKGSIIVTQADYADGTEWLHASIAWADGEMPTYEDLALLHRVVFGRKRYAYQVFAPESRHVNLHANALHLWGRADGSIQTPDFGELGTI